MMIKNKKSNSISDFKHKKIQYDLYKLHRLYKSYLNII